MKIALVTDMHFGCRSDSKLFLDQTERFFNVELFPYMEKHGIDTIIDLGDTFDRRKYVNFETLRRVKDMWYGPLQEKGIKLYEIVGNHCVYYRNTNSVNSNDLLTREYPNTFQISEPMTINFDGLDIDFIPWINTENGEDCYNFMTNSDREIAMGHFEFSGFQMYRGSLCRGGISHTIVKGYDMVMSGHFHHRSSSGNIHYLGTPYQTVWSDYNDIRGFHVFDTETRELEFIPNYKEMFIQIHYDDLNKENFDEVINFGEEMVENAYIKVIVVNRTNNVFYEKYINKLYLFGAHDIKIIDDHFNEVVENDDVDVIEGGDTLSALNSYIRSIENPEVPIERLESEMKSIYNEAQYAEGE